jgi:hypothetical protein
MESVEIIWELAVVGFIAGRLVWSSDAIPPDSAEASIANSLEASPERVRDASRSRFSRRFSRKPPSRAKNGACR